jgi:hypothetical protein
MPVDTAMVVQVFQPFGRSDEDHEP